MHGSVARTSSELVECPSHVIVGRQPELIAATADAMVTSDWRWKRELEWTMEHALTLTQSDVIDLDDLRRRADVTVIETRRRGAEGLNQKRQ
jgi:hypothetical protein